MRWSRPEQVVVLLGVIAAIAGGGALLVLRRPGAPVRVIEPSLLATFVVQVDGEVERPGLYEVIRGARVADAIHAAGGMTAGADVAVINLARFVRDGERITVPRLATSSASPASSKVRVNTAAADELETLPGIGPVLARRIVAHRSSHGPFLTLEDMLQVEGIGPKLLERLRPLITTD